MPKNNKKIKVHHYSNLPSVMKELTQATKFELSLRTYESLNISKKLTYQEFTNSTSCKVALKPLELQYKLKLNPT